MLKRNNECRGKRKRSDCKNAVMESFDHYVILYTIRDLYLNKKTVPTIKKLIPVLKEDIHFQWSEWVLRKVL